MQSPKSYCSYSEVCGNWRTLPIATYSTGGNSCFKKEGDTPDSKSWSIPETYVAQISAYYFILQSFKFVPCFSPVWNHCRKTQLPQKQGKIGHCLRGNTWRTTVLEYFHIYKYVTILFAFIFSSGIEQDKICTQKQPEAHTLHLWGKITHTAWICSELREGGGSSAECTMDALALHRQLDLTSWVEFDLISFGTVSHTLNSSVNGVTILESYWGKTTLPLMLLSQADRAQSHTGSLCVFLSSLSP